MIPKLITFDCANTLLWTDWQFHTFAIRCAENAGLALPSDAAEIYLGILMPKLPDFGLMNQKRSLQAWRAFWVEQATEWLTKMEVSTAYVPVMQAFAEKEIFTSQSQTFRRFDDVIPCLENLREQGYALAILSNWDHSLHGCLDAHGLTKYFDRVFASLEEGVEKPKSGFFQIALDAFGVQANECLHVGDDPRDDVEGAKGLGIPYAFLDRAAMNPALPTITSLSQINEVINWYS